MDKISLPDGGQYRVEDAANNKIRLFVNDRIDGFSLSDRVVKVPAEISNLTQDGLTTLVNSMVNSDHIVACPHCDERKEMSRMRSYTFAGSICDDCWNKCVCRQCNDDDWIHSTNRSTRRSNKKKCPHCGTKLITKVATG